MATTTRFRVNKKGITPPVEAIPKQGEQGILVESTFGAENIQPAITPLEFTFVNDSAKALIDIVNNGGIFENTLFYAELIGDSGNVDLIDGYLDLTSQYEEVSPVKVITTAKFKESTLTLDEKINSFSLDVMMLNGFITNNEVQDIEYVVEKENNATEIAILTVSIFLMTKELAESIEKIAADVNVVVAMLTPTVPATVDISGVVYQVGIAVVRLAYTAIMLNAIIKLINDLLSRFISKVRTAKGLKSGEILKKGFLFLGYGFETDIEELDNYVYCPSITVDGVVSALPKGNDYGYTFGEFLDIFRKQFYAKIAVVNGVVQFRSENSDYWEKESTFIMEDVLLEDVNSKKYNSDELVRSVLYEYLLDSVDSWTYDNYKGTNYAVNVEHTTNVDEQISGLKDFQRYTIPVALGNRKDELNELEDVLLVLAKVADVLVSTFGGKKDFSSKISKRVGMMKISGRTTSLPKILYMNGSSIPANHRDLTSMKYLYDKYLSEKSFVLNDFKRQRIIYSGVEIGFGLENFKETVVNSYFKTAKGERAKFMKLIWDIENDRALADFWVTNPNPSRKIKETYIEQD